MSATQTCPRSDAYLRLDLPNYSDHARKTNAEHNHHVKSDIFFSGSTYKTKSTNQTKPLKLPLVGIETNPGPRAKTKIVVRTVGKQQRKRPKRRISQLSPAALYTQAYANTLNDPFEYPAVKVGFDCLVGSNLATAYIRGSLIVNADGSFGLASFPGCGAGFVYTNNSGASGITWNNSPAANINSLNNDYRAARVLSGGIRMFALFPETAAPGVLFAGTLPITQRSLVTATSPFTLSSGIASHLGIGTRGATSLMRPQDNDSFVFYAGHLLAAGWNSFTDSQMSVPYIVGLGFPVGTVIWYEVIQNLECLSNNISNVSSQDPDATNASPTAASYFPSLESMMQSITPFLSNAAIMEGVAAAANSVVPGSGHVVRSISRFNSGRNAERTRLNYSTEQSRRNTAVIQEMSGDAEPQSARTGWLRV